MTKVLIISMSLPLEIMAYPALRKTRALPRERDRSQNPDRAAVRRRRPEVADDGDRRRHEGRLDEVGRPLRARDLVPDAEELRREALGDGADLAPLFFWRRRHEQRW